MSLVIRTPRLTLVPSARAAQTMIDGRLVSPGERQGSGREASPPRTMRNMLADSLDPSSSADVWIIAASEGQGFGFIGVRPPSVASLRLRAIGWRSLELVIAVDPRYRGQGYATEAVEAVAAHLRADPVIFALVGAVEEADARAHRLMQRCRFEVLGEAHEPSGKITIYERAL